MKCPECSEPVVVKSFWDGVRHAASAKRGCAGQELADQYSAFAPNTPSPETIAPDTLLERFLWRFKWFRQAMYHHARYCDCADCEGDGGYSQRRRRGHDICGLPASCSPPTPYLHTDKRCPHYDTVTLVGSGASRF